MDNKEQLKQLLNHLYEVEGLLTLAIERVEKRPEILALISEKMQQFRLPELPDEPELQTEIPEESQEEDAVSSYEIEDEDETEAVAIEDEKEEESSPGYISNIDEDSAFGCYADFLPDSEEDKQPIAETEDRKPDTVGTRCASSNLSKCFNLNDMFRFATLFGGRKALTELLGKLDMANTPEEVDTLIQGALRKGSDEEVVEEFILKVNTEKF